MTTIETESGYGPSTVRWLGATEGAVVPSHTPWGAAENVEFIAPGLIAVSTMSHGGIWVGPDRLRQLPAELLAQTHGRLGMRGWFEEDVDWSIPAVWFGYEFIRHAESLGDDEERRRALDNLEVGRQIALQAYPAWMAEIAVQLGEEG